jgi:hypothetical protein
MGYSALERRADGLPWQALAPHIGHGRARVHQSLTEIVQDCRGRTWCPQRADALDQPDPDLRRRLRSTITPPDTGAVLSLQYVARVHEPRAASPEHRHDRVMYGTDNFQE